MNLLGTIILAFICGSIGGSFAADYRTTRSAFSAVVALVVIAGALFWSVAGGLAVLIPELAGFLFIFNYARKFRG
ncbi:MAG: hypothetical protein M0036_11665 [Desulfobacteraceae bacterium]|nr:hypothetical protein [Desulfobacteraceae bacterium]